MDAKYRTIGREDIAEEMRGSLTQLNADCRELRGKYSFFIPVRVVLTCWDIATGLTSKTLQNIGENN